MIRSVIIAVLLVFCLGVSSVASATDRHVPADYATIQDAIDACVDDDTVIVADGVYTGAGNKDIDFGGKKITVRSESGPLACIIDCEGSGRGFIFQNGETGFSRLSGFTVRNGNSSGGGGMRIESSPRIDNMTFLLCHSSTSGGGIAIVDGSPQLENIEVIGCTATNSGGGISVFNATPWFLSLDVTGCSSRVGGGIRAFPSSDFRIDHGSITGCTSTNGNGAGISLSDSELIIRDVTLSDNTASGFGAGISLVNGSSLDADGCSFGGNSADIGGGVYTGPGCTSVIEDCSFREEVATRFGGGCTADGANVTLIDCEFTACDAGQGGGGCAGSSGSNLVIEGCSFDDNTSLNGGAVFLFGNPSTTVTDCSMTGNIATSHGGAVYCAETDAEFTNCQVSGNTASGLGGAFLFDTCDPTVDDCSVADNSALGGAGGSFFNNASNVAVTNCILWANSPNEITNNGGSTTTANYCNVQGGWGGTGNLDTNPMFVNMGAGDLHLLPASPCIDAGDTTAVPAGVIFDLDGNPRFVDRTGTPNTGNGSPPVDMGCFEVQLDRTQFLPTAFTISRGVQTGGVLSDLFSSDDSKLSVKAGLTLTQNESPLQVIVTTTSTIADPVELGFTLEASVNTAGLMQTLELFNYDTGLYEEVDFWSGSASDSIVEVLIDTNPERFVDNGTFEMKARILYTQVGLTLLWPWSAFIDQTVWTIGH